MRWCSVQDTAFRTKHIPSDVRWMKHGKSLRFQFPFFLHQKLSSTNGCQQVMSSTPEQPHLMTDHAEYKSSAPLPRCGTALKGYPSSMLPEGLTMSFQQLSHSSASLSALSAASFLYRCSQGSSINVLHRNPLSESVSPSYPREGRTVLVNLILSSQQKLQIEERQSQKF